MEPEQEVKFFKYCLAALLIGWVIMMIIFVK